MAARGGWGGGAGVSLVPPPTPSLHRGQDGSDLGSRSAAVGNQERVDRVGGHSIPNIGKGSGNQDTFVSASSNSKCFVGVFDGHGQQGDRMSHFSRDVLSRSFLDHEEMHTNPRSALEYAYKEAQRQMEKKHGPDAQESGTTAVSAFQHHDRLFVANVGDSRAVLGRCDTSRGTTLKAVDLSSDHKPGRPDERQRIVAAGGKVDQGCFPIPMGGTVRWQKAGPERVMDKHGMGGLAVSRSLGDLSLRPYVSAKPEVTERRLDSKDKFMILGSDGIWDQLSSKEAVDIAGKHMMDPNSAAREIAGVARKRWHTQTGGQLSDDITAVVVRLDGRTVRASPPATPAGHGPRAEKGKTPREQAMMGYSAPSSPQVVSRSRPRGDGGGHSAFNYPGSPVKAHPGLLPPSPGGHKLASAMGTLDGRSLPAAFDGKDRRPKTEGHALRKSHSEASGLGQSRPNSMPAQAQGRSGGRR